MQTRSDSDPTRLLRNWIPGEVRSLVRCLIALHPAAGFAALRALERETMIHPTQAEGMAESMPPGKMEDLAA